VEKTVSIEEVLNSRCSCDFDGDPKKNHWGIFEDRHPSDSILESVLRCVTKTPQYSKGKLVFWLKDKHLFLGFEKTEDSFDARLLHIESGMQSEAVYLSCTALDIGTCIRNLGINGTEYGDRMATARHVILENKASYSDGKTTSAPPGPEKPMRKGKHLPEPRRSGNTECLSSLDQLTSTQDNGSRANDFDVSQMLWAAKGRTPHYVKSHPWGLTIPTMGGGQNYTSVYLVRGKKLYAYVNWTTLRYLSGTGRLFSWWVLGNPTHDIRSAGDVKAPFALENEASGIILCRNEKTNRGLWEVGYMLENMLLQAKSLGISYRLRVFKEDEIEKWEKEKPSEPVAALLL